MRTVILLLALVVPAAAQDWTFAASGDSRNCGDVVMPSIAVAAKQHNARFYWHLGDLRAIYDFDADIVRRNDHVGKPLTISDYQRIVWDDFIQHQLDAFAPMSVFLGIGNHEISSPKDRNQFLIQFADWLDAPVLRDQRLADNPNDHRLKTYFHWIDRGVDFIYLDNVTNDQFDSEQLAWFERVLARAAANPQVKTIVAGMHVPLPDSLASGHSMNDWPGGEQSGRRVYQDLLKAHNEQHKNVYVLASHSHFYFPNIFNSDYLKQHGGVLPGWIVGTAGAFRYPLPPTAPGTGARANVYGFLLGTVHPDGKIDFDFKEVKESDVPENVRSQYSAEALHDCYAGNSAAR